MNKGILSLPIYNQNTPFDQVLDEVLEAVINSERWGLNEAFFGEHIADKHERITSSLMMVSALSSVTNKILLGTLTTNLNFYKPAVMAGLIAMADNISKGRLILGIGSGANRSDIEAINLLESDNYSLMLESYNIIKKILNTNDLLNITSKNFISSTLKTGDKELGLGYFNKLYKERQNLEIIMPALNQNSHNVKVCAENNWMLAISNFCCDEVIDNHINNYLKYSSLNKKEALKKIKLTKLIYVHKNADNIEKFAFSDDSPYMEIIATLFKKLKTFNKHECFGKNINTPLEAAKNILLYGTPDKISNYLNLFKEKYGDISSIIYITVPKTNLDKFDNSLKLFSENVTS